MVQKPAFPRKWDRSAPSASIASSWMAGTVDAAPQPEGTTPA
jgi:hypothetical protein